MKKLFLILLMSFCMPCMLIANVSKSANKFYVGAELGMTTSIMWSDAEKTFVELGSTSHKVTNYNSAAAGVYLGYDILSNLSLETGFVMPMRKIRGAYTLKDESTGNWSIRNYNIYLLAKIKQQLRSDLSLHFKLGIAYSINEIQQTYNKSDNDDDRTLEEGLIESLEPAVIPIFHSNALVLLTGAGLDYQLTENFFLSLNYTFLSPYFSFVKAEYPGEGVIGFMEALQGAPGTIKLDADLIGDHQILTLSLAYKF